MNTAHITGRAAGIYGQGATPARPERDNSRTDAASAFVSAVREAFRNPRVGLAGGTFGTDGAYIVGGFSDSVVIRASAAPVLATRSAVEFAAGQAIGDGAGVGFWEDPATGRIWLDAVRGFDDYAEALDAARENGERYIYRASDGECIPVN